ncbi:capsid assembly scaffolding protein Gp46 family protein [Clostridium tertium]|uniref:capsid assembly scaffolding protein Gp46 family protein n=1 Tax=Clostridium tertium TaxID=1559 RepID=UPI003563F6CE
MLEELNLTTEQMEVVNKVIQSETDKVRTEYSKKIKDLEGKLPKELSADEKALQERIKALEEKERDLQQKELTTNLQAKLKDKGLNEQLANYLKIQDVEDLETYISDIAKVINVQVDDGYKPKNHERHDTKITKNEFNNMNYVERMNLYNNNKTLYDALSK